MCFQDVCGRESHTRDILAHGIAIKWPFFMGEMMANHVPNSSIFSANLSGRAQLLQPRRYATSKDVDTIDNNAVDWR